MNEHQDLLNRAAMLHQSGQFKEAIKLYQGLLPSQQNNAQLLFLLGLAQLQIGELAQGTERIRASLVLHPGNAHAHYNLGVALQALERPGEALISYGKALAILPDHAESWLNRGTTFETLARNEQALASYDKALALQPRNSDIHYHRGNVLGKLGRSDEALASYDEALMLRSDYADVLSNRGNLLRQLRRVNEALADCDMALAIKPDYVDGHINRGAVLLALKRLDEALDCYDKVLAIRPDHAEAAFYKATILILKGEYPEGWALYESRLNMKDVKKTLPAFPQPAWRGEDLRGKKLLVYMEQGLGDLIQFSRYLPQLHALGAELIVGVPKSVLSFISTLRCPMTFIAKGAPLPAFDLHCSIASLPHLLKTTVPTIPGETPYLFSDPEKVERWQEKLGRKTRPRIGLAWSGSSRNTNDMYRSVPLAALFPLFELPLEWHSLQIEYRPGDLADLNRHSEIRQYQDDLRGFAETAAFVECMDLVITVDSSMAHVAGALGKPVWILLPFSPDYRWMLDRTDSPWYPTAQLYRQPKFDDWQSVITDVRRDLALGLAK